jgi:asparagine synthase (glutamine-hydrolysing)
MCGIAGIIELNSTPLDLALVKGMARIQQHRGPDGEGFFWDNGAHAVWVEFNGQAQSLPRDLAGQHAERAPRVALAHRRLAIIDLSPAGRQPMSDAAQRYWITYNGEVYNYIELRRELESLGYSFRSGTDTEVILAAYTEWGADCLSRFNGMWAFAIWDAKERTLFCARDRFGVKPFYYYWNGKQFMFASEIKALLANRQVPRTLNDQVILDYLLSGSMDHLPGQTFLAEIQQLLPAHYLILKDGALRAYQYWQLQPSPEPLPITEELDERCRELILDAARLRLRSDVPVGGTLSGGIDSATLTCLIDQRLADQTYHVFSAQFHGHQHDESQYVRDVMAQARHLELHETTPSARQLLDELPQLFWHQEEPFGDTSIYAHYCLMRLTRQQGVKVILTGQGADEVFGGYGSYYRAFLGHLLRKGRIGGLRREIRARSSISGEKPLSLQLASIYHALPSSLRTHVQSLALYQRSDWINPDFKRRITRQRFDAVPPGWSRFNWYLAEAISKWSIPHLVHHDDRNSMAFSIESRAPYLDYRLAQLLFSTADEAKISNGRMKVLLRRASQGIIPQSITARNDKIGFYTPMSQWLSEAREFIWETFDTNFARENPYLHAPQVTRMAQEVLQGNFRWASPLWWSLSLCLWHEVVVKGKEQPALSKLAIA